MTLRERILKALKDKYTKMGFSSKTLELVASMIEANTEDDDTAIETAVTGIEALLKGFQSDSDRRVTALQRSTKPKEGNGGDPEKPNEPAETDDDTPKWAKGFAETNKQILERLQKLEGSKVAETRKQSLEVRLKDVDPKLKTKILKDFSRMQFDSDEAFEEYLMDTESDIKEFKQLTADKGLGSLKPGGGRKPGADTSIQAGIKAWAEKNNVQTQKTE